MFEHHRQGDLLFVRCLSLPEGLTPKLTCILVEGEVTGHAHRLLNGDILTDAAGNLFVHLDLPSQIVHEEHRPVTLAPGAWQIVRQREYSPEAIRTVLD